MQRKHRKQMSKQEVAAVESLVKSITSWVSKSHYAVRSRERNVTRLEVYQAIAFGQCVEAKDDNRVVMRHHTGVCVVVEIPTHTVVTVWYNDPQDQHWTLDLSQYRWVINLIEWSKQHDGRNVGR
jgi:hypothetical protein